MKETCAPSYRPISEIVLILTRAPFEGYQIIYAQNACRAWWVSSLRRAPLFLMWHVWNLLIFNNAHCESPLLNQLIREFTVDVTNQLQLF